MVNINCLKSLDSVFIVKYNFLYKCTNYLSLFSAFQKALSFQGIEALYVLTDGKPDTSCSLILKEIERLRKKQDIKIHTISFSCTDRYMILWKNNKKKSLKLLVCLSSKGCVIKMCHVLRSLTTRVELDVHACGSWEGSSDAGDCDMAYISRSSCP